MPDYSNGKIYKIINSENEIIYIGSTAQTLSRRFCNHEYKGNGNRIILLENCPCNSREELIKKEQEYIESHENLLNKNRAFNSEEYNKEYYKEYLKKYLEKYREENKDEISEKRKVYYEENKDKIKVYYEENKEKLSEKQKVYNEKIKDTISEKKKIYYEKNKDRLLEKSKVYNEENKNRISEKNKIKITCECGCEINKHKILRHKKTKKHIKLMESNTT